MYPGLELKRNNIDKGNIFVNCVIKWSCLLVLFTLKLGLLWKSQWVGDENTTIKDYFASVLNKLNSEKL